MFSIRKKIGKPVIGFLTSIIQFGDGRRRAARSRYALNHSTCRVVSEENHVFTAPRRAESTAVADRLRWPSRGVHLLDLSLGCVKTNRAAVGRPELTYDIVGSCEGVRDQ